MSVFNKTPQGAPRRDLRLALKKAARSSPFVTEQEGVKMEKELFPPSKGGSISKTEVSAELRKLQEQRWHSDLATRTKINREIDILNKLKKEK